jgi:hypothetical protein
MSNAELKRRLHRSCLAILAASLCAALLIYLYADAVVDDSLGYVIVNGAVYPSSTRDSKIYRREVQRFGGKAALAIDDFSRWFARLWRGRALAGTVASLGVLLSLGIYLFAACLVPDSSVASDENNSDTPG